MKYPILLGGLVLPALLLLASCGKCSVQSGVCQTYTQEYLDYILNNPAAAPHQDRINQCAFIATQETNCVITWTSDPNGR